MTFYALSGPVILLDKYLADNRFELIVFQSTIATTTVKADVSKAAAASAVQGKKEEAKPPQTKVDDPESNRGGGCLIVLSSVILQDINGHGCIIVMVLAVPSLWGLLGVFLLTFSPTWGNVLGLKK